MIFVYFKIIFFLILNLNHSDEYSRKSEKESISIYHPIHVSITNIDYKADEKQFDISVKLFADDFEKIINHKLNTILNIGKDNQNKKLNKFIDKYFKSNFVIIINRKNKSSKKLNLIESKYIKNENVIWLFYIYKTNKIPKKVEIINKLMLDLYLDQKNLLIFTCKNTQESYKFDYLKNHEEFTVQ